MPDYTTNYALIKPKKSENYDIDDVTRKNMDTIDTQLFNKVDKIPGKGLSSCDFTEQYKTKLDRLNNYDDTDIKNSISNLKNKQKEQDTVIDDINNDINLANRNLANVIQLAMTNQKNIDTEHETNTQQDKDIANLKTENEELKAENERLNQDLNALPSNTAEGEYITLTDSADSRFNKFKVLGKSTQKTRSGKNKLDLRYLTTSGNFIENVDIETGSFELVNCWSTTIMYAEHIVKLLKPDTQYKMIADVTLLEKPETLNSYNNHNRLLILYNANAITTTVVILAVSNTTEKNNWQVNATKHIETNFTTPADLSNYDIRAYNYNITEGETDKASGKFKYENVMILEATEEDETFEQYGVSPSPEFSSKTRNVGDNINHFNKSTIKTGYYLDNTGAEIANINYAITDYMKVEENENYVYQGLNIESSFASKGAYYNSNKEFVDYFDLNAKNTLMKIPENVKYVRFTLRILNNNQDTFKFEKGTIATPYSPYECGNIEFDICNNNLTNTDIVASLNHPAITINSKSSFSIDLAKGNIANLQSLDFFFGKNNKNKGYKLSYHLYQNNSSFRPYLLFRYSDGTFTVLPNNGSETEMDVTLTSTEGKTIEQISFGWGTQTGGGIATLSDIYLRQVDDNSEFQEQEKQEFVFPLAEGQRLYEGSYLADNGIHHKRKQIELDENTGFFLSTLNDYQWFGVNVVGVKKGSILTCNYLQNYIRIGNYVGISNSNASDRIYIAISKEITTLEQLKTWLRERKAEENPVIVEYELAEEETEAYTDEQQAVYDEIVKTAKSYKIVTNIFSTNEISPKFEVNYRRDIDTYIDNKLANVNEQILNIAGGN